MQKKGMAVAAIIAALLTSLSVYAEDREASHLDLSEAIHEAKDHSPTLQRFRAATEETSWRKFETLGSGFLPKISTSANHYLNQRYQELNYSLGSQSILFPEVYPATTISFDMMIPIFDGFANVNHLSAANLNLNAAENEQSHAEFKLEHDVRLAFYQALGAQELENVTLQNVKTLEEHQRLAEARLSGGAGTKYDVLRVKVQLSEARTDALNATDNVTVTRKKLTQLLGAKEDHRPLTGKLPTPHADLVQSLTLENLPSARSDIQALELRANAADKERSARQKWMIPTVSFGADYTMYNNIDNSINSTNEFRSAYNVGVFLQWNLFDGGVSIARDQESKYHQIQADRSAEEAIEQIPYDFDLWKRKYLTNAARYEAKQLDVESSEESVRLALAEQKAGKRSSTEVLDAELDLFRSKAGVVDALLSSAEAQIELEKTIGKNL